MEEEEKEEKEMVEEEKKEEDEAEEQSHAQFLASIPRTLTIIDNAEFNLRTNFNTTFPNWSSSNV